jgi:hypothetical protein
MRREVLVRDITVRMEGKRYLLPPLLSTSSFWYSMLMLSLLTQYFFAA